MRCRQFPGYLAVILFGDLCKSRKQSPTQQISIYFPAISLDRAVHSYTLEDIPRYISISPCFVHSMSMVLMVEMGDYGGISTKSFAIIET